MKIIITPTGSFTLLPILTAIDTIFADVIRLRLELYTTPGNATNKIHFALIYVHLNGNGNGTNRVILAVAYSRG